MARLWLRFPATPSSDRTRATRRRSLLLSVIGIAVLPLAWRGPSCGQDFDFHLQNWLELAHDWRHGLIFPSWAGSANYGAGEPRFIFYPPLARVLGALLGSILPWSWTPLAFTLLCLLGAAFSMRAMARAWLHEDSATLAACLYVVNPYMLFLIYERGALAELLAAVWIPLLVLFALRNKPSVVPLAFTLAALWLTNAPAGVMGTWMLAVIVLVAALQSKSLRLAGRSLAAVPAGLALAGFWLVPALDEERWVEIARATGPLMRVEDSFLFHFVPLAGVSATGGSSVDRFDTIYHNQVLGLASWVAVALIAVVLISALWLWARRLDSAAEDAARQDFRTSRPAIPLAILALLIVLLQFPISDAIWRVTPELHYLQFPWRWMLVLGMIASLFAAAVSPLAATRRAIALRAVAVLLLASGLAAWASWKYWQPCDEEDNVAAQIATFRDAIFGNTTFRNGGVEGNGGGFEGTDEYTPKPADNGRIQQGLPLVRVLTSSSAELAPDDDNPSWSADSSAEISASVRISRWQTQHIVVTIATPSPADAVFRVMDYPAWLVVRNGAEIQNRPRRPDGLMTIPLEAGENRIEIRWRAPADQWAGIVLSFLALAITLGGLLIERRKARLVPLP